MHIAPSTVLAIVKSALARYRAVCISLVHHSLHDDRGSCCVFDVCAAGYTLEVSGSKLRGSAGKSVNSYAALTCHARCEAGHLSDTSPDVQERPRKPGN